MQTSGWQCSTQVRRVSHVNTLPSAMLVQYDAMACASSAVSRPPGGHMAQHLTWGKRARSFSASRAATPPPRLWPVVTRPQPCSHHPSQPLARPDGMSILVASWLSAVQRTSMATAGPSKSICFTALHCKDALCARRHLLRCMDKRLSDSAGVYFAVQLAGAQGAELAFLLRLGFWPALWLALVFRLAGTHQIRHHLLALLHRGCQGLMVLPCSQPRLNQAHAL